MADDHTLGGLSWGSKGARSKRTPPRNHVAEAQNPQADEAIAPVEGNVGDAEPRNDIVEGLSWGSTGARSNRNPPRNLVAEAQNPQADEAIAPVEGNVGAAEPINDIVEGLSWGSTGARSRRNQRNPVANGNDEVEEGADKFNSGASTSEPQIRANQTPNPASCPDTNEETHKVRETEVTELPLKKRPYLRQSADEEAVPTLPQNDESEDDEEADPTYLPSDGSDDDDDDDDEEAEPSYSPSDADEEEDDGETM